jgi:hypothetical protein
VLSLGDDVLNYGLEVVSLTMTITIFLPTETFATGNLGSQIYACGTPSGSTSYNLRLANRCITIDDTILYLFQ